MKKTLNNFGTQSLRLSIVISVAIIGCALAACEAPVDTGKKIKKTTSSISGKAFYVNSDNHAGITITLEKTDGLRSVTAITAMQDINSGASGSFAHAGSLEVRSVNAARSVASNTQTAADGSYAFTGVAPGTYTIYASSPNSSERAVAINNVTLEAGKSITAADLNLTATGSISGRVLLDDNTDSGNFGFLVCVAGTSYMAMTGDNGRFIINNVPAGNNYLIVIMKGSFTAVWTTETISVTGGGTATLEPNPRQFTTAEIGGIGIVWKGEHSAAPASPQMNWAYYNTTDKTSYIWNGIKWDVLATQGEKGSTGSSGSIVTIGEDGNWYIDGVDTGIPVQGPQGQAGTDGETPFIGPNGNWWIGINDTGIKANGSKDTDDPGSQGPGIVTGVNLNNTTLTLYTGDTETLIAAVLPAAAPNKNVSWFTSNPGVAFVNNGTITAISPGVAIIIVSTQDGEKTAQCVVRVYKSLEKINRFQAIPTTDTGNNRIKYSYTYGRYDFYYIYLGELLYNPSYNYTIKQHAGNNWEYTFSKTDITETSLRQTIINHSTVTKSVVDTNTTTTGGKVSAELNAKASIMKIVDVNLKLSAETSWSEHTSNTTSFQQVTSLTNTEEYYTRNETTLFESDKHSFSQDDKPGYYRFSMFSDSDVYLYVIKDRRTNEIYYEFIDYVIPDPGRFRFHLDYCETGDFGKTNDSKFELDISLLEKLPEPVLKFSTVTFNMNNTDSGSTEASPHTITITSPATTVGTLPQSPTRSGWIFKGWNTAAKGSGTAFSATTPVNGNIEVFAQWTLVDMVWVEGGTFELGKNLGTGGSGDVTPVSTVTLTGFYMGNYQVTQELYQKVMGTNPSYFHGGTGREAAAGEIQSKRPVEQVSWYDALVFCNRLSDMEGLSPAYRISGSTNPTSWGTVQTSSNAIWNAVEIVPGSTGYRLPTEAQWEYAAKGGNTGESFTYAGSNTPGEVAWYTDNSGSKTHQVGLKKPNGLGIHDMSGNVFEWCRDWHGNYTSAAKVDPTGAVSGTYRVVRGGIWNYNAQDLRSAYRGYGAVYNRYNYVGFRLVRP